jgi:hypothetical protein
MSERMKKMDRKKELKMQYKETKTEAGVYQIKNTINQKILIGSTMNLKTLNGKKFELEMGVSTNRGLQQDLKEFGAKAFVIEELERLKVEEDRYTNLKSELKKLEEKWLDKLKPYGDQGYNTEKLTE